MDPFDPSLIEVIVSSAKGETASKRIDNAVAISIMSATGASLDQRRKVALFVGGLRGHRIAPEDFTEHTLSVIGVCRLCEQAIVISRNASEPIRGAATRYDCPVPR